MDAKLLFILNQQTPMIHFQWNEDRAILRASDVKPRLDRFIYDWIKRSGKTVKKEWQISSEHKALNYKMKIVIPQGTVQKENYPKNPSQDLYFGNMGKDVKPKKVVFYEGDIELQIICFYADLRQILIACMETFFLIHNFGTRQNRGLGSFMLNQIKKSDGSIIREFSPKNAGEILQSWYREKSIYKIDYNQTDNITVDDILYDGNVIYKILKSGINDGQKVYVLKNEDGKIENCIKKPKEGYEEHYVYIKSFLTGVFLSKNIGGEKRYMKKKGLAPIVKRNTLGRGKYQNEPQDQNITEFYYTRGLLGIGNQFSFIDQMEEKNNRIVPSKKRVIIQTQNLSLERIPSPIFYKILENVLYIIPREPEDEVYGTKVVLKKKAGSSFRTEDLDIPGKEKLAEITWSMDQLWMDYIKYLNCSKEREYSQLHLYNFALNNSGKELCFLRDEVTIKKCKDEGVGV